MGTCGTELPEAEWTDALGLAVAHMGCTDLVVALTAVHAVLLLSVQLLDDQAIVEQVNAGGGGGLLGWGIWEGAMSVVERGPILLLSVQLLDDQAIVEQVNWGGG